MIIAPVQGPMEIKPVRKELDDINSDNKIREYEKENENNIRDEDKSKTENSKQAVKEKDLGKNIDVTA